MEDNRKSIEKDINGLKYLEKIDEDLIWELYKHVFPTVLSLTREK